jgi:hypothetical protein
MIGIGGGIILLLLLLYNGLIKKQTAAISAHLFSARLVAGLSGMLTQEFRLMQIWYCILQLHFLVDW